MEFKIGDWVRHSNGKPFKIKAFEFGNFVPESTLYKFGAEYHPSYIKELWQPEVGEYCWTYTTYDNDYPKDYFPIRVRSIENNKICYIRDGSVRYAILKDCEPFIGELPSFIKD